MYALFLTEISQLTTKIAVEIPESADIRIISALGFSAEKPSLARIITSPMTIHKIILIVLASKASLRLFVYPLVFFPQ